MEGSRVAGSGGGSEKRTTLCVPNAIKLWKNAKRTAVSINYNLRVLASDRNYLLPNMERDQ